MVYSELPSVNHKKKDSHISYVDNEVGRHQQYNFMGKDPMIFSCNNQWLHIRQLLCGAEREPCAERE